MHVWGFARAARLRQAATVGYRDCGGLGRRMRGQGFTHARVPQRGQVERDDSRGTTAPGAIKKPLDSEGHSIRNVIVMVKARTFTSH